MSKRLGTALVFAFILACLAVDLYPPSLPVMFPYEVDESVLDKVELDYFSTSEKEAVREQMLGLFSPQCTVAFSKARLRSPLEVVTREGVVLRPSVHLYMYPAKELGLVSDVTRRKYWEEFSGCNAQAGTVSARLYGVSLTTDGRARVFLHDTAFHGEWLIFRKLSLHDVLVHEFMHVGGQPPTPNWFFQHDLAGFEHYDEIMQACR